MKDKIIITILSLAGILSIAIGHIFLPLWGYSVILIISMTLLISYIVDMYNKHTETSQLRNSEILATLNEGFVDLNYRMECGRSELLKALSTDREVLKDIIDRINVLSAQLDSNTTQITQEITNHISKQEEETKGAYKDYCDLIVREIAILSDHTENIKETVEELDKLYILVSTALKSAGKNNTEGIETIIDEVTKNVVLNHYRDGNLVRSMMKNPAGYIIYELEYDSGRISISRNYNVNGKMNLEQVFYDNGQVRYRNEFSMMGMKTTEFDINGKIK